MTDDFKYQRLAEEADAFLREREVWKKLYQDLENRYNNMVNELQEAKKNARYWSQAHTKLLKELTEACKERDEATALLRTLHDKWSRGIDLSPSDMYMVETFIDRIYDKEEP